MCPVSPTRDLTVCSITYGTSVECTGFTAASNPPGPSNGPGVYGPECIRRAGLRTELSVDLEDDATADRTVCIERDMLVEGILYVCLCDVDERYITALRFRGPSVSTKSGPSFPRWEMTASTLVCLGGGLPQ
jgi:hypothetical protein